MLPSRKQRREMARKFGLAKKTNFKEWSERLSRTIKAGQAIHEQNLQDNHNRNLKLKSGKTKENGETSQEILDNE